MSNEWVEWHRQYGSSGMLAGRLREVQTLIRAALTERPPGPVRVISMCAGDGRDLLGALADHPRRRDVRARLVELTPELVALGRREAERQGLAGVKFVEGDASVERAYAGAVPADLVLVCGVFGNIRDEDVRGTVRHLPELCAPDATVIWTRGRFEPDLTPTIRTWFRESGFSEVSFVTIPGTTASVGVNRLAIAPRRLRPRVRLFTFLPVEERPSTRSKERSAGAGRPRPAGLDGAEELENDGLELRSGR
jgi:hypothetical protein